MCTPGLVCSSALSALVEGEDYTTMKRDGKGNITINQKRATLTKDGAGKAFRMYLKTWQTKGCAIKAERSQKLRSMLGL